MPEVIVRTRKIAPGTDIHKSLKLVDPARRSKVLRFSQPEAAALSLAAGILLAEVCAECLSLSPDEIRIAEDAQGKPYVIGAEGFFYSLTHTRGSASIAYGDVPCGIDGERIRYRAGDIRVIDRCLTADEKAYILGGHDAYCEDCAERFFRIWTMKESMVKQSGEGIRKRLSSYDTDPVCMTGDGGRLVFREFRQDDLMLTVCVPQGVSVRGYEGAKE